MTDEVVNVLMGLFRNGVFSIMKKALKKEDKGVVHLLIDAIFFGEFL
jgi:hypothetical protein